MALSKCCDAKIELFCNFCGSVIDTDPVRCSNCQEYKITPERGCTECGQLIEEPSINDDPSP